MHHALFLLLLAPTLAFAQDTGKPVDRPAASFNLGPLGGRGKIVDKGTAIELTEVDNGDPLAKAKLEVGDVLVTLDRHALSDQRDALYQLAAILRGKLAARGKQTLALGVRRGTLTLQRVAKLEGLGRGWAAAQRAESFKLMARRLSSSEDGGFATKFNSAPSKVAATAMVGLAAFADGGAPRGKHSALLRGVRGYVIANTGKETVRRGGSANASQANWSLAFGTLFLAEYLLAKGKDKTIGKALVKLCATIEANQETNGGWAHGPGGANSLGYTDLAAVTTVMVAAYGAAGRAGAPVKKHVLEKAITYLVGTSGNGESVGYSLRGGQVGMAGCGRTSAGLIAFLASGRKKHAHVAKLKRYIAANLAALPEEHASPMYQMAFGGWGAALVGKRKTFLDLYELELLLARKADGSFYPRLSKENVQSDLQMGDAWPTGAYLLAWCVNSGRRVPFRCTR